MWNRNKSIVLSKLFVLVFIIALALVAIFAPWIIGWLDKYSVNINTWQYSMFLTTIYSGSIVAGFLLVSLYRLLNNISKSELFTKQNTKLMRWISWCCFIGAAICGISSLYYLPWFIVCVSAGFMGIIVRIVKNLVQEAVSLKEENDFTI